MCGTAKEELRFTVKLANNYIIMTFINYLSFEKKVEDHTTTRNFQIGPLTIT
jgi:hypothetical protein